MYCFRDNMITKKDSYIIKSIAIFMMIYHHFFAFPEKIFFENMYLDISICGYSLQHSIGVFCKICVSIFAFLSGYGLNKKNESISFVEIIKKIVNILMVYWLILLVIYVPLDCIGGRCDVKEIVRNIFLLETSIIHPSWYVKFYVQILVFFWLYIKVGNRIQNVYFEVGAICLSLTLLNFFIRGNLFIHYLPSFMWGYIVSKYALYDRSNNKFKGALWFIYLIMLVVLFVLRIGIGDEIIGLSLTSFIVPLVIYILVNIFHYFDKLKLCSINSVLAFVGKYSTYLWLLHAIFQIQNVSFLQRIAYFPKLSFLIVTWTIIILLPLCVCLDLLIKKVIR